MKSFIGKHAVVTGSNRGLGLAFVEELLDAGIGKVYAFARDTDALEKLFPENPRVQPVRVELRDLEAIKNAARQVSEVDLFINNAAMLTRTNLLDVDSLDKLQAEWEVNVRGNLAVVQSLAPQLLASSDAAIVQINSIAALCPFADVPTYAATKAAALSLTQALRREFAPQGVAVFSVLPGPLATDMAAWLDCAKSDPKKVATTVLTKILRQKQSEIFPEPESKKFIQKFQKDPCSVIFFRSLADEAVSFEIGGSQRRSSKRVKK